MTDAQTRAVQEFVAAGDALRRMATNGMGVVSKRRGAEARYSDTYQKMVRLGVAPQLKGKYR